MRHFSRTARTLSTLCIGLTLPPRRRAPPPFFYLNPFHFPFLRRRKGPDGWMEERPQASYCASFHS
jgi:hypothetical protein